MSETNAQAGAHTYGYVAEEGLCVLERPGCLKGSTTVCHDRYVCIPCLHVHKHELEADGVGMIFGGQVTEHFAAALSDDVPAQVEDAREVEFRAVLRVLHELYAVCMDRGAYEDDEVDAILKRAKEVLSDYGIEV